MIIWTDDNQAIRMVSYTPRDRGTTGGYDVKSIPEGATHYNPDTKEFGFGEAVLTVRDISTDSVDTLTTLLERCRTALPATKDNTTLLTDIDDTLRSLTAEKEAAPRVKYESR